MGELCFFFNDPPTPEIYTYAHTLSLHDALPISRRPRVRGSTATPPARAHPLPRTARPATGWRFPGRPRGSVARIPWRAAGRSEEHTSELQSLMRISYAVFCLQKKKKKKYIQHLLNN